MLFSLPPSALLIFIFTVRKTKKFTFFKAKRETKFYYFMFILRQRLCSVCVCVCMCMAAQLIGFVKCGIKQLKYYRNCMCMCVDFKSTTFGVWFLHFFSLSAKHCNFICKTHMLHARNVVLRFFLHLTTTLSLERQDTNGIYSYLWPR